ncbi:hypothetical protein CI238_10845 [Colletotrichum incanum]|uniref:Uncharacterized protein n=1 Tax=Colletotrichum incanum TaxID=1573173 RepID=A0A162MYG0_COLIC|nr:hypothetical protein CI238_10845 [Colletotrichum incanum]
MIVQANQCIFTLLTPTGNPSTASLSPGQEGYEFRRRNNEAHSSSIFPQLWKMLQTIKNPPPWNSPDRKNSDTHSSIRPKNPEGPALNHAAGAIPNYRQMKNRSLTE